MGYNMFVTILFLTTVFFFHLNLSSNLQFLNHQNDDSNQPIQQTNHPTFELSNRYIFPSRAIFREYIAPTLNSKKICSLYKFFQSKNPSISHQNFLPPERFFKSRTVLTLPEFEHSILYNFHVGAKQHQTQISQFQPILYNPTTKTLETVHTDNIEEYENIPDDGVIFFSEKQLFPCPRELNTKPLGDENKTVMIAIEERAEDFFSHFRRQYR